MEKKIELSVTSSSGIFTHEFHVHQTLRHVMEKAIEALELQPEADEKWQLRFNNVVLNLDDHIEQANLPDHATLELVESAGKRITLTVASLSGNYTHAFHVHQKLQHVEQKAFKALNIVPSAGEVWELRYNDVVLNLDETIEHAKLPNHATLTLAPHEGGGGGLWISK